MSDRCYLSSGSSGGSLHDSINLVSRPAGWIENIDTLNVRKLREWFVRRDSYAALANPGTEPLSGGQLRKKLRSVYSHAKQHGHRFIYSQDVQPVVALAPGAQGRN